MSVVTAHAEEQSSAQTAPATDAGTDVVRLKNGGLLRGKISELLPGESVTIITLSGKTRELPMSEVDYAGPAAKDPQAASQPAAPAPKPAAAAADEDEEEEDDKVDVGKGTKPYVTVHGREARLHIIADEPGVTFHRQVSSAVAVGGGGSAYANGFERICTAPCEVSLPAGTETIALSRDGDPPIAGDPVQLPAGEAQLRGSFNTHEGVRMAGWLTLIGGVLGGAALALTSSSKGQDCSNGTCVESTNLNVAQLAVGIATFGAGMGVGLTLVRVSDAATVEVESASAAPGRSLSGVRGVALSGRF
jgi:hypothetical protein